MTTSSKIITINDIPTMVTIRDGSLPAVVFIHGNSLSRKEFVPLFSSDILSDRFLISYDLPGHGESARSSTPASTYSMDGYGRHLAGLLDELGLRRFVLAGSSLGGHIAMQSLAGGLVPEPAGLVTISSPPLGSAADFPRAFLPLPKGASLFKASISREEAELIAASLCTNTVDIPEITRSILATDPEARSQLMQSLATAPFHDECALVTTTSVPLLLCFAEQEKLINLSYLEEKGLKEKLGPALTLLPGDGHLPDLDNPRGFQSRLLTFLEGLDG